MESLISHLKERFNINHTTGDIFRKDNGRKCNTPDSDGYIQVCCGKFNNKRKMMKAHQIVYLTYHGHLPDISIDHIDRDKINNSISNLRPASHVLQGRNKPHTGVVYRPSTKTWRARIRSGGFQFEKTFKTEEAALSWRKLKESELWKEE